jgi:Cu/Ag efflux protein CusF
MLSIHKVVGVLSCGFVLCLGLAYAVQAENVPAPAATKTIMGELFRIEEGNYFVKAKDGKEISFHTDRTTQMIGQIKKGDSIEAKVNDQDHAVLVRQTQ